MKKAVILVIGLALTVFALPGLRAEEKLEVANFNSGLKPNLLGGNFGAWDKDPLDEEQTAVEKFDDQVKRGDAGFSMNIYYDVDAAKPAFNGFWMKLNGLDGSKYDKLVFWAKGDKEKGFTDRFKLELKSGGGTGSCYISGISSDWKKFEVPLSWFRGLTEHKDLQELVIVFEDRIVTEKKGAIWFDDFYFLKKGEGEEKAAGE